MEIPITSELEGICRDIESMGFTESQWAEIESDDMFQLGSFVGGYDADETEFCFSYFSPNNTEYWFQFGLATVKEINNGIKPTVIGRLAE